jgi:hypothetical protein
LNEAFSIVSLFVYVGINNSCGIAVPFSDGYTFWTVGRRILCLLHFLKRHAPGVIIIRKTSIEYPNKRLLIVPIYE